MARWNHFRAHERIRANLAATVSMSGRGLEAQGRVVDIGLGGAALEVAHPLRLGEPVQIRIWGDKPLLVPAEVAWVAWAEGGTVRAGVRFRPEDADLIGELLVLLEDQRQVGS